jgi:hypothetical protein
MGSTSSNQQRLNPESGANLLTTTPHKTAIFDECMQRKARFRMELFADCCALNTEQAVLT